jgi:hypothetical protein
MGLYEVATFGFSKPVAVSENVGSYGPVDDRLLDGKVLG